MIITIHYDFTDGTELSYKEGCIAEEKQESFTTNCLDFFVTWVKADDVIIIDAVGNELSRKILMSGKNPYTVKDMRDAHNLHKMFVGNSFIWQTKEVEDYSKRFFNTIKSYGWSTDLKDSKKYGSVADYYLRHEKIYDDNYPNPVAYMLIDDGAVSLRDTVYHIYATNDLEEKNKIFEGHLESESEFKIIMKVLGFD